MSGGGSLVPPILDPSSLYTQEARRDATRIRIYNNVLNVIYTKIRAIARIPGNEKTLWYVVPEFIPGTPRFDVKDCILYLVWNLRNAGYLVNYTHPNFLYISWQNYDERYRERDSPWAQVLEAAREQVITQKTTNPAIAIAAPRPRPTTSLAPAPRLSFSAGATAPLQESEVKRKSVLKKTTEYRPLSASVVPPSEVGTGVSGTLSSRHVSFV